MSQWLPVVVPAIPPKGPAISLLSSSVHPDSRSDPQNPLFELGAEQLALLPADLRTELQARRGEAWTRGITYAPENHWAAENRGPFDQTSADTPPLPAPTGLAATASASGGTLSAGAKQYVVTAVNANGETTASSSASATTSGSTGSVRLSWNQDADNVTYKVYGRVGGSLGLLATVGPFDAGNPPAYVDTGSGSPGAVPPVANTTGGVGSYANLPIVTCIPWAILAEDSCSSFGFEERDFKGRALRLLENATPQAIEREFWSGTIAQAAGLPNNYLTNPASYTDLTPGSVPSVARGQQILQDALAQCGFGGQGMIHCQPQTAPNLLSARRVGNLLLDLYDNIIVPGVGYPGSASAIGGGDAPGTAVMFATDLVMTRVEQEGIVYPETFAEALDRGQGGQPNTIRFRAQKLGCAYFDGACHFAVRVSLAA